MSSFSIRPKAVTLVLMGLSAFSLDLETLKLLAFAMEDINNPSLFDTKTKLIAEPDKEGDSLIPLPSWTSKDGFGLMEAFVQQLKNPQLKQNLRHILQSGRGVFKEFKAELKQHPLFEKQWFQFKDKEIKRRIVKWHNDIHDEIGLTAISDLESSEPSDEILFDLDLRDLEPSQIGLVMRLGNDLVGESSQSSPSFTFVYERLIKSANLLLYGAKGFFTAEDEACALISLFYDPKTPSVGLVFLFVDEAFRGLGLGTILVAKTIPIFKKSPFEELLCVDESDRDFLFESLCKHLGQTESIKTFSLKSLATKN